MIRELVLLYVVFFGLSGAAALGAGVLWWIYAGQNLEFLPADFRRLKDV